MAFGLPKRGFDIDGASGTYGMQAADDSDSLAFLEKMRKISVYPANSSTISGTVPSDSIQRPVQHKTFYANGRFWFFYSDGTYVKYRSSQYLGAWTPANTLRACSHGVWFAVWFDGLYVHYAVTIGGSSLYYRRGTPNADGTLSWSQGEQTITPTSNVIYNPSISVDSSGHPWIVYEEAATGNIYKLYAIKSSTNDGTWSTASGFPALIQGSNPPASQHWLGTAIPLTSDKMVVIFGTLIPLCAKAWDGSSWKTAVNTTKTVESVLFTAIPSQGDEVHAAFLKQTAYDIIYAKYDYATNSWGTETTLVSSVSQWSQPILSLDTRDKDLYLFWTNNYYIYYKVKRASSGSWDANPTVWIYDASNAGQDQLTCSYQAFDGYVSVGYLIGSSPYYIKFAPVAMSGFSATAMASNDQYEVQFTIQTMQFAMVFIATGSKSGTLTLWYKGGSTWTQDETFTQSNIVPGTTYRGGSGNNIGFRMTTSNSSSDGSVKFVVTKAKLQQLLGQILYMGTQVTNIFSSTFTSGTSGVGSDGAAPDDRCPSSGGATYTLAYGAIAPEFPIGPLLLLLPLIVIYFYLMPRLGMELRKKIASILIHH